MSKDQGDDRRKFPRVPLNLLIQYRFDTFEDFIAEYASNISLGGMFIKTGETKPEGTHVYLQFSLKDGTRLIEGLGHVVRVVGDGDDAGMGIEFVNFDEDSWELVEAIVAERVEASGSDEG